MLNTSALYSAYTVFSMAPATDLIADAGLDLVTRQRWQRRKETASAPKNKGEPIQLARELVNG